MQLVQIAQHLLEQEIPASEGLPPEAMRILRLLRWQGAMSRQDIAAALTAPPADVYETYDHLLEDRVFEALLERELIRVCAGCDDSPAGRVELGGEGVAAARRVIDSQREAIRHAWLMIPEENRVHLAEGMELLAANLATASQSFSIPCSDCWAYDQRECIRKENAHRCPFRLADRAQLDPDPVALSVRGRSS